VQGLLTAREYFDRDTPRERALREAITALWRDVEWDWFTRGGEVLYWHWSPRHGFAIGLPIRGWNECLIAYVLAASSPTHPIEPRVYHEGWARGGRIVNRRSFLGLRIPLGRLQGGPLFFAHYSFLCLDPRGLRDRYADYWEQNVTHARLHYRWCVREADPAFGYGEGCWGLTASLDPAGYRVHQPGRGDNGTVAPTAALASMPYTPRESLAAARYFYHELGDRLWGPFGFYDAFNLKAGWFARRYIAFDQGPIVVMIENFRSGLLWRTFMRCREVREGLARLGFSVKGEGRSGPSREHPPDEAEAGSRPRPSAAHPDGLAVFDDVGVGAEAELVDLVP